LHEKMGSCKKPIFPILPSLMQAAEEVSRFHALGHVNFSDEVSFGYVLTRINRLNPPYPIAQKKIIDTDKVREIITNSKPGFLSDAHVFDLLNAAGIITVKQAMAHTLQEAVIHAEAIGFPLVMKVSGPLHKSDVGGVVLHIQDVETVNATFKQLMNIQGARAVIVQQQSSGIEIYIGAKKEPPFGHLILCGMGGVFVEIFKDVSYGLVPLSYNEADAMMRRLKSFAIIQGARGKAGVDAELIIDVMLKLSALLEAAPEIVEMDINPLLGNQDKLLAVDARIKIAETIA